MQERVQLKGSHREPVADARIALLNAAVEIEKTEVDAKIQITSPDQLQAFLDQEENMLKGMVDRIAATGANVLFVQKGIDDRIGALRWDPVKDSGLK